MSKNRKPTPAEADKELQIKSARRAARDADPWKGSRRRAGEMGRHNVRKNPKAADRMACRNRTRGAWA